MFYFLLGFTLQVFSDFIITKNYEKQVLTIFNLLGGLWSFAFKYTFIRKKIGFTMGEGRRRSRWNKEKDGGTLCTSKEDRK